MSMATSRISMSAEEIVQAIREEFTPLSASLAGTDEWSLLEQVPSAGVSHSRTRIIDVLLMRNWSSGKQPYERIAVEVKVSRADFFRDTSEKRAPWEALAHRFAYATPAGLVTPDEVPEGCWLMEVSSEPCEPGTRGHATCRTRVVHWNRAVKGGWHKPHSVPDALATYLGRRASRAEHKIAFPELDPEGAASLAEELRLARRETQRLQEAVLRERRRNDQLAELISPLVPQVCAVCAQPIIPNGFNRFGKAEWMHEKRSAQQACPSSNNRYASWTHPAIVQVSQEQD